MSMLGTLRDLENRVKGLEEKRDRAIARRRIRPAAPPTDTHPTAVDVLDVPGDAFGLAMLMRALAAGFTDTTFVRCQDDYYDQTLDWRRRYLSAPHTRHLTKSIVLDNKNLRKDHPARFVCCVIPYAHKIDPDALQLLLSDKKSPPTKKANFRLAEQCVQLTGYIPNAVTPLGIRTPMPVALDARVQDLQPPHFWLGGGQISLKWHVTIAEFVRAFHPLVGKISVPEL